MHLKALFEFLSGLEQNNNRPWFAWNKPAYDVLREEFEHLVADVTARVHGATLFRRETATSCAPAPHSRT
jgi:uncharacterized protein (DUF2461 family)